MLRKPARIFDRDQEWSWLARFATDPAPGPRLGLVYGRRRQGKTLLVEAVCRQTGGMYHVALEHERALGLQAVGASVGEHRGLRAPLAFEDWVQAIDTVFALGEGGRPVTVVLDELPYLVAQDRSLPSIIQRAVDQATSGDTSRTRLLLCGSAVSVMEQLRIGSAPLFGRATLDLMLHPFDYRTAAAFWGIADRPELAFLVHAVLGGTPAYRTFARRRVPSSLRGFDAWVREVVLDPSGSLLTEPRTLLAEEPTLSDRALYHSILAAISRGRTRTSEIASVLQRPQTALAHPLRVLEEIRLIERQEDALRKRRASYRITEPIVRFYHAVLLPHTQAVGLDRAADVWPAATGASFSSLVLGPHLEDLARRWTARHADREMLGGWPHVVAPTVVHDPTARTSYQVDIVVLPTPGGPPTALAIGEARWSARPIGLGELERLERIRGLMAERGQADGAGTRLLLFGAHGFTAALTRRAADRPDVELVDLERLYAGD